MLDVHQKELLVLLLMMEPERGQIDQAGLIFLAQQGVHPTVHVGAISADLVDSRT